MPKITIRRGIRSARRVAAFEPIKEEITQAIETRIIPRIEGYFQNVVNEWAPENRPKIETKKTEGPNYIEWYTRPVGDNARIWDYVTNGTKRHYITPKRPGYPLRFLWGGPGSYKPKTGFGGQYRGPGRVVNGRMRRFMIVDHPGNKGRNFEKHFKRYINPAFRKETERAVKRGAYRYEHQ